jgi:hypothetical protein
MSINWEWKSDFVFLSKLRSSGIMNMHGAAPYLECHDNNEPTQRAIDCLLMWMENSVEIEAHLKKEGLIE